MTTKSLEEIATSTMSASIRKMVAANRNIVIKPDSPRTIEACLELGLKIEELQQKSYEDFIEPGLSDDIIKVRFEHYQKRYYVHAREVMQKKRELMKYRREKIGQSVTDLARTAPAGFLNNTNRNRTGQRNNFMTPIQTGLDHTTPRTFYGTGTFLTSLSPSQANNFKKTMSLLRSSHDGPIGLRSQANLLTNDTQNEPINKSLFETRLSAELEKFNRIKEIKQREAVETCEEEIKRLKSIQNIYDKEKRRAEFEKKQKQQKQAKKIENRRILEEKMRKVKETEEAYREKKKEDEQKIKNKLEEARKKFAEEAEERRKHMQELEEIKEKKRRDAENRRKDLSQRENERLEELKLSIERKIQEHSAKYEEAVIDKVRRLRGELLQVEDRLQRNKEIQEKAANEFVQQVVVKLINKEENALALQKKSQKQFKEKLRNQEDKSRKLEDNIKEIKNSYMQKMSDINERFKKVEENFEHKKEVEEKIMKIKQEQKKLKMQENLENFERNRRRTEYEQNKIIERERTIQEKLIAQKSEKEIIQKVRIEAALQAKIECERITHKVNSVAKILHVKDETDIKALKTGEFQKGVKILKRVIKPEYLTKLPELLPGENQPQIQNNQSIAANSNGKSPIPNQKS